MDMDQLKLLVVAAVLVAMVGIALQFAVRSLRGRARARADAARALLVTVEVRMAMPEPVETHRFVLADAVDDRLGDAGEVVDAAIPDVPAPPGRGAVDLVVRLDGPDGMPALRRALAAAGVPPSTRMWWDERGVRATARAG